MCLEYVFQQLALSIVLALSIRSGNYSNEVVYPRGICRKEATYLYLTKIGIGIGIGSWIETLNMPMESSILDRNMKLKTRLALPRFTDNSKMIE